MFVENFKSLEESCFQTTLSTLHGKVLMDRWTAVSYEREKTKLDLFMSPFLFQNGLFDQELFFFFKMVYNSHHSNAYGWGHVLNQSTSLRGVIHNLVHQNPKKKLIQSCHSRSTKTIKELHQIPVLHMDLQFCTSLHRLKKKFSQNNHTPTFLKEKETGVKVTSEDRYAMRGTLTRFSLFM